jgi:hypothetical protein
MGKPMDAANVVPTFDNVAPLVADSHVRPTGGVEYVFRCPVTGFEARATADLAQPGAPPPPDRMGVVVRGTVEGETQNATEDAADRAMPGASFISGIASDVFRFRRNKRSMQQAKGAVAAAPDMRQLLVDAFGQVAHEFTWDGQRWVHPG